MLVLNFIQTRRPKETASEGRLDGTKAQKPCI
jgi:hypothetical protein